MEAVNTVELLPLFDIFRFKLPGPVEVFDTLHFLGNLFRDLFESWIFVCYHLKSLRLLWFHLKKVNRFIPHKSFMGWILWHWNIDLRKEAILILSWPLYNSPCLKTKVRQEIESPCQGKVYCSLDNVTWPNRYIFICIWYLNVVGQYHQDVLMQIENEE